MPILDFIQSHNIRKTTLAQDKAFLEKLGKRVRDAKHPEITPKLIHTISSKLHSIRKKLDRENKLSDKLDNVLIDLQSDVLMLEQKLKEKKLDKEFFKTVLALGNKISRFANTMRFMLASIIAEGIQQPPWMN